MAERERSTPNSWNALNELKPRSLRALTNSDQSELNWLASRARAAISDEPADDRPEAATRIQLILDRLPSIGYRPPSNTVFAHSVTRRKTQMSSVPTRARDDRGEDVKALPGSTPASTSSRVLQFQPRTSEAHDLLGQLEVVDPQSVPYVVSVLTRLLCRARVFK
jgi:hypothetical protein